MEQKTNKRPPVKKTYDEENSRFFREALQKSGRRNGKKICTRDSPAAKSDLHEPPICDSPQMSVDPSSNFIDQIARSETKAFPRASSNSKSATRPNSTTSSATRPTSTFTTRPTSTSTSTSTTTSATQSLISEGPCLGCLALTEDYEPDLGDFCHVFCRDLVELPASSSTSTSTTAPTSTSISISTSTARPNSTSTTRPNSTSTTRPTSTFTSISTSTSTTRPTTTSTNRSSSASSSTTGSLSASSSSHPTSMSFSSSFTSPIANQGPPIVTIPTSNINSEATLSKRKKQIQGTSSWLYKIFSSHEENPKEYRCPFCDGNQKTFVLSTNITNLNRHLKRKHLRIYDELKVASQSNKLTSFLQKHSIAPPVKKEAIISSYFPSKTKEGIATSQILQGLLIVKQNISFKTLDTETYRKIFLSIPTEEYFPITSRILKGTLLPLFVEVLETRIRSVLKDLLGISLSFDGWSDLTNIHYLGVSAHFLDENNRFRDVILGVLPMHESLTSSNIEQRIDKTIDNFIDPQTIIAASITDGAKNMLRSSDYFSGDAKIYCIDHLLNLIVNKI